MTSVTGLPEGCGLSVVGMVLYDIILHQFLRIQHPSVMQSYVDNLELQAPQAPEPDHLVAALKTLTYLDYCYRLDMVGWVCQ